MQRPNIVVVTSAAPQVIGSYGRGFRLEPLTNAITGNPVEMLVMVRLNRNDSLLFVLEDDGARSFHEPFEVVELLGGTPGDRWRMTLLENSGDLVGSATRVRRESPVLANKVDFGTMVRGTGYYLPSVNGTLAEATDDDSQPMPAPFDVSRFGEVQVHAGLTVLKDPAYPSARPAFAVVLQVLSGPEPTASVWATLDLSVEAGSTGIVALGNDVSATAPDGAAVGAWTAMRARAVWVRVLVTFLDLSGNIVANNKPDPGSFVRLVGLK